MNTPIIYFDNAATTSPKPEEVYAALDSEIRKSGNPGRGGHTLALNSARTIFDARESIAEFLGITKSERLIFTPGCTQSINTVIRSMANGEGSIQLTSDSIVLVSGLEHNAVSRPLRRLQSQVGFKVEALPYKEGRFCELEDLARLIESQKPALFILTEGSNVTGEIADLSAIADMCKSKSVPVLVDAAQTAGRFSNCLAHDGITFWCASAHKGLMGPPGLGLLYVHPGFDLEPLVAGGTGSASELLSMPSVYPDHLEAGTMPAFLIAGLSAGVGWLEKTGVAEVAVREAALAQRFFDWAVASSAVKLRGFSDEPRGDLSNRLPVVSFELRGKTPDQVADALQRGANIAVRSGLHCSAVAHKALGTLSTGLIRASFGFFNSAAEVDTLCLFLEKLALGAGDESNDTKTEIEA